MDSETIIQVSDDDYGPFGDICHLESGRKAILWNGAYFFQDGSYLNKEKYGVPPVAITTWNLVKEDPKEYIEMKMACSKYLEMGGSVKETRLSKSSLGIGDIYCTGEGDSFQMMIYCGSGHHLNMMTNVITLETNLEVVSVLPAKSSVVILKDPEGYVRSRVLWDGAIFNTEPGTRSVTILNPKNMKNSAWTVVGFQKHVKPKAPMDSQVEKIDANEPFMDTGTAIHREQTQSEEKEKEDLFKSWKDDLFDAGVRVAIRQGQKATVAHIAAVLCRNLGNSTEEFYNKTVEFLSSPVASAIILRLMSVGISAATSMTETPDPVRNALARELRIESLASPMEAICEVFTEPLRKEVCGFLEGVIPPPDMQPPPPPNKHQLSSPSTNQSLEFDQGRDMCELYHTPSLRILPLSCLR